MTAPMVCIVKVTRGGSWGISGQYRDISVTMADTPSPNRPHTFTYCPIFKSRVNDLPCSVELYAYIAKYIFACGLPGTSALPSIFAMSSVLGTKQMTA